MLAPVGLHIVVDAVGVPGVGGAEDGALVGGWGEAVPAVVVVLPAVGVPRPAARVALGPGSRVGARGVVAMGVEGFELRTE